MPKKLGSALSLNFLSISAILAAAPLCSCFSPSMPVTPHFPRLRLTLSSAATKLPLVCSRGRLVCRTRAPGLRTNRLLWRSRYGLPHGGWGA